MALALYAGNRVSDFQAARAWYERLPARESSFLPHETEAVWELGEHRYLYIVEKAENPGGGLIAVFDDDLDGRIAAIAARGIEPDEDATHSNGVRKATFRDAGGNEIEFGGGPE